MRVIRASAFLRGNAAGIATVGLVALFARLAIVAWAASRFPPAADGQYYHALAQRLALGLGYTWQWPDGAVTPAAHYPVGYPAMLAAAYGVLGPKPVVAMLLGALFGAVAAVAAWRLARPWGRGAALSSGLLVAVHPALVPYAAALMTEVVAAAGLLVAAALAMAAAARPRVALASRNVDPWGRWVASGIVLGVVTLVRPQCVVLAPVLGFLAAAASPDVREREAPRRPREATVRYWSRRLGVAMFVTLVTLGVCLPWTIRNCRAMGQCALVSVNGGWNLLIGTQTTTGAWQALDVPVACRNVWDEAEKDACFARAARAAIATDPLAALARIPAKVGVTFDYFGGAPWYLHESNAAHFDANAKTQLGIVDAVSSRLVLIVALLAAARRALAKRDLSKRTLRAIVIGITLVSLSSACSRLGAPAYLGLVMLVAFGAPYRPSELLFPFSAAVVVSVAVTHAVFFGAGRYGLVVAPFVAAMAGVVAKARSQCQDDSVDADQAIAGFEASASRREESPSTKEHDAG